MLKYILFLLSEDYEKEAGIHREMISGGLEQEKVQVEFFSAGHEYTFPSRDIDKDHTLVVTDKASVFHELHQEGYYVIALYHDGNREESFSGARYAVEDLPAVEYRSYEEAFNRLAGIPWDILETERMKVRETTPRDIDEFYRIYSNPSITRYMEDLFPDRKQEIEYIKAYVKQIYEFYGFGLWTVLHKESGRVIGRAGLNVREGYEIPELG
ncbi:MAG: GNAT family N-acetyltransferase, partial [Lachnospiraceae bacterium]|nr:GNAT family N-acetyltransferase [Lachnospiraceae bacterium]